MIRTFLFFLTLSIGYQSFAQDSIFVLSTDKLSKYGSIVLGDQAGWRFQQGSNPDWANPDFDDSRWQTYKPQSLRIDKIDQKGPALGCLRFKLKVDSSLAKEALHLRIDIYAAVRVFMNGKEIKNRTDTGLKNGGFTHKSRSEAGMPQSVLLDPTRTNVLVIYSSEQNNNWLRNYTYMDLSSPLFIVIGTKYYAGVKTKDLEWNTYTLAICVTGLMMLALFFWLMAWQNPLEKQLFWIATLTTFLTIQQLLAIFYYEFSAVLGYPVLRILSQIVYATCISLIPLVISQILLRKTVIMAQVFLALGLSLMVFILFFSGATFLSGPRTYLWDIFRFLVIISVVFLILKHRNQLYRAQWVASVGLLTAYSIGFLSFDADTNLFIVYATPVVSFLTFPFALLVYIALTLKQNWVTIQRNIHEITILSSEKQQLLTSQNERLEQQVEQRTAELKASQTQLIQKEKLASLGELTAGIAHEIQNPLNFVNNFSEVNAELVSELEEEQQKPARDTQLEAELLSDLKQNLQKITHHGQRASSIVKGMLEHSRATTGERQLTDLNQLADEYLRLSFHGLKAKDNTFSADYELIADENLPLVNVVPQEIGRVLLNLINNAFYAVHKRFRPLQGDKKEYFPKITVFTKAIDTQVIIQVQDNGVGIPAAIKDKIFQPFFTTKPTGEGTGLGLSLTYDIITKGHGGTLEVETKEGEGTTFVVTLPL